MSLLAMWFPSVGMFGVVLAIVGAIVSILAFTGWKRIGLALVFAILGIGELVSIHRADIAHETEVRTQHNDIEKIREELRQSEVHRQVDEAYIKAKIEDYAQFKNFAEAIQQFARINAEYTKRQFQGVVLSNKQLRTKTLEVIGHLRDLDARSRKSSEQLRDKYVQLNAADKSGANRATLQIQEIEEVTLAKEGLDRRFRQSILPDTVYVRNELLKRGAKEPPPGALQQSSLMITFGGILAGPDPCGSAADYLEFLLKQLSPQGL